MEQVLGINGILLFFFSVKNGGIPRMKLKAIDIMGRVMRIEVEQTRKIARETSVCALVLHIRKYHVWPTNYLHFCFYSGCVPCCPSPSRASGAL